MPKQLTVQQATRQVRAIVDRVMPGAMATVDSRGTADPNTLAPLMRTTVTFPAGHPHAATLAAALTSAGHKWGDVIRTTAGSASYTITRKR